MTGFCHTKDARIRQVTLGQEVARQHVSWQRDKSSSRGLVEDGKGGLPLIGIAPLEVRARVDKVSADDDDDGIGFRSYC